MAVALLIFARSPVGMEAVSRRSPFPTAPPRVLVHVRPSSGAAVPTRRPGQRRRSPRDLGGAQTLGPRPGSSERRRLPRRPRGPRGSACPRASPAAQPPASEVSLGFPLSLPGVSVGPHGSLLLLGVLGSNSICGRNQRHCAGEVAVFLKALSPLAQETDPKGRTLPGEACSIPGFQSSGTLFKKTVYIQSKAMW